LIYLPSGHFAWVAFYCLEILMKKPVLTAQEKTRILIACVELPIVQRPPRDLDYVHQVMETVLNFYIRAEAVFKSLNYFRDHVQGPHDVFTHARLAELVAGFADTREGDTECSQFFWANNHWKRARLLRGLVAFFASVGISDQATLDAWAAQANFERDFQGKVPGLGLAVFQWLIIRCGVQTVKLDVWVFRFAERILGRRLSGNVTVGLFNELAPLVGTSMSKIDATIWFFERMDMGNRDVPALRIVFWNQLRRRLQERIAADESLTGGQWRVNLDEASLLRYDEAGLHMSGSLRLPGEDTQEVTHVEVKQSSWRDRFILKLTLRRDKPITDELWATLQPMFSESGWGAENLGRFEAQIKLDVDLLMGPDLSIEDLLARVDDAVERTVTALAGPVEPMIEAKIEPPVVEPA
jgi:hypothetical protein